MDDPLPTLSAAEGRVLGALIEKQITTPDYYPLTLNALTNACNQLTNRDPIVAFDEQTVVRGIDGLREKRLATLYTGAESRVAKYKHTLTDALLLTPGEIALLCVLLLRGPQTLGELRPRTERLFKFDNLPEVEASLDALAARQPQPLVVKLPRQPGTKESRFAHLLAGPIVTADHTPEPAVAPTASATPSVTDRVARLEQEVTELRRDLAEVRQTLADFRKQFD
jgi:uncharacterized protein YceH (UPF0502 family)